MARVIIYLPLHMGFPKRLIELRKAHGMTQQNLANTIKLHVNQIKRYEAGTTLHVSLDETVFSEEDRAPSDDFKMQSETLSQFTDEEKMIAKALFDSLILQHTANQLARSA